ncbi:hypothetical protein [Haloarcula halophila]|uniref:hypothetical protein n=1 Tax=Haloarcula TaxID=2237 RepID=UPI0023E42CE1|nr:hypothetical protein [Halomicroarcula sp. DFY41]
MNDSDDMSDHPPTPEELNVRSLAGLVVSVALAAVGLFILPVFQSFGLAFRPAFWLVLAIEGVALAGVVISVLTLHRERTLE